MSKESVVLVECFLFPYDGEVFVGEKAKAMCGVLTMPSTVSTTEAAAGATSSSSSSSSSSSATAVRPPAPISAASSSSSGARTSSSAGDAAAAGAVVVAPGSVKSSNSPRRRASGDELGPSDEVKVYNNEGEDERDEGTSAEKEAELLDEKTSLIKEEEQVRIFVGEEGSVEVFEQKGTVTVKL